MPHGRPAVLVYVILTIVTVCVTIVVTYFLLNNEDYRWVCLAVWGAWSHLGRAPLGCGSRGAVGLVRPYPCHGTTAHTLRFADGPGRLSRRHAPRPATCSCIRCDADTPGARSSSLLSARVRRVQVYYFFVKTKMSGFFQTIFYFGYSAPPPPFASLCSGAGPALSAPRCVALVPLTRVPRRRQC